MAGRGVRLLWCTGAATALVSAGCAKSPAGGGRGTRIIVTMQFQQAINPANNYFFVIRNWGDPSAQNGPVPPFQTPFGGNGFAAGATSNLPEFTDFVAFGNIWSGSVSGYTLWHVPVNSDTGQFDPKTNVFINRGEPASATRPNGTNTLQFELDLAQIAPAANDPTPPTEQRPRYLQVNIIATTSLPANQPTATDYVVDAFGDQRFPNSGSFNAFLQIDTTVARTYKKDDALIEQEREEDTFSPDGSYDPSVDLTDWSIQVIP
jgi:hypothetical protein